MDSGKQIIVVCESEDECEIVDILGKPGDAVKGEIKLSDGYGECYIRLEPAGKNSKNRKSSILNRK
jgi:hypothetical protein